MTPNLQDLQSYGILSLQNCSCFEVFMKNTTFSRFPIDNSAILYLALIRRDHTNTYRFTMELKETICPATLQQAVDRIYRRFPTIIAGFQSGFFRCYQIPAEAPPQVQPDPGCLITMTGEEIRRCAFRIYYRDNTIIMEAFHALTDGYGAVACFTTLAAEYLRLKHGIHIPVCETLVDLQQDPTIQELEDAYLEYEKGKPLHLPSRYAYQLPGGNGCRNTVFTETIQLPAKRILEAAHTYGVSPTSLISAVMASSIMEVQQRHPGKKIRPVRIMVPVDLRKMFPSRTFRNFILYVLPTMEPDDSSNPISELLSSFTDQIRSQLEPSRLASIIAYNVRTQNAWYFRIIPLRLKLAFMRLAYRYFGESNSSITLTNLGNVRLSKEMQPYVENIQVTLTPRANSPYNCAIISCNGQLSIQISRFLENSELEGIFREKLEALLLGDNL